MKEMDFTSVKMDEHRPTSLEEFLCPSIDRSSLSKDYNHLKELLDNGEKVVVLIQILPIGYRKYKVLANTGTIEGRKYYNIGYGFALTNEAFYRQCEALDLEYIET